MCIVALGKDCFDLNPTDRGSDRRAAPPERVLITGASGHIGGALLRQLRCENVQVFAISRHRRVGPDEGARWISGDLTDYSFASDCIHDVKPDIVFHLASVVTGSRERGAVRPTLIGNMELSINVLLAADHVDARLVLAGSMEDPGPGTTEPPSSPYAVAKEATRRFAELFHSLYRTRVAVARIFMVYGPGQQPRDRFIPYIVDSLNAGRSPRLTSGSRQVDWIHVDDVARGLLVIGRSTGGWGRSTDLGSGIRRPLRDVGDRVLRLVGADIPLRWGARDDRPFETEPVAHRRLEENGWLWEPQIGFDEGLAETVNWLSSNPVKS